MSEEWLEAHAPGFQNLPDADRRAILNFSFLWSLFEARVMDNSARADHIRKRVDKWVAAGTLQADLFDGELAYFRARYFADGALTHHFPHLRLRPGDHPGLVEAVTRSIRSVAS